jgi:hypothetical protein
VFTASARPFMDACFLCAEHVWTGVHLLDSQVTQKPPAGYALVNAHLGLPLGAVRVIMGHLWVI